MNFDKLFKTIDALMSVRNVVRDKSDARPADTSVTETAKSGLGSQIETRLTNVLMAALKEAFDRDHARLELERVHLEEQRRRAEEAMRMEVRRQAVDRELGRLRLLAGAALVGWIVSVMLLVTRTGQMTTASMVVLAGGSLLLLGSLGASFTVQQRINASPDVFPPGAAALWLLLAGLGLSVASLLA